MPSAEQQMVNRRDLHGVWRPEMIGHPLEYYELRHIFLDCRGTLKIHPTTNWGWQVMVLTKSHNVASGQYGPPVVDRPVTVDEYAWICSRAILYNCHVKHHGIVACGAVVRNMTVEPYTVVAGNPAVPIKKYVDGKWERIAGA